MLRWVSPDLENPPPSWGCLRGALEPTMWFLGPVAEFRNQAFLFSYLCLNSRKFRKRLGVIDLTFHCCSFNIEGSLLGGQRDRQTMGMPRALCSSRERILAARAVDAPTSAPGLRTSPGKVALSARHTRGPRGPRDADPARPLTERESASGEGGSKASKRRISGHEKLSSAPLSRNPGGDTVLWRSRMIIDLSRGPRTRAQSRGGCGEPGSCAEAGVGVGGWLGDLNGDSDRDVRG